MFCVPPIRCSDKYKRMFEAIENAIGECYINYFSPASCKVLCLEAYKMYRWISIEKELPLWPMPRKEIPTLSQAISNYNDASNWISVSEGGLLEEAKALEKMSRSAYKIMRSWSNL